MNTKTKHSHRVIAIFFVLTFLQTLIPYNQLWANNNGPNAPEAASFEPVDATDMVNLATGGFTYVLPLLNVPSPEGGYPLALAYHAGIAMDQEASWVGLGWNLNAGAINRSVNGYADDYNAAKLTEYFYDEGGEINESTFGIGYMSPAGVSVGVGVSWGSHRSLGGHVSVGFGIPIGQDGAGLGINAKVGTQGSSIGIGYKSASGLSIGLSASTNGTVGVNAGFDSNNGGFSIGASTDGTYSHSVKGGSSSIDFDLSSDGVGYNVKMGGISQGKSSNGATSKGIGLVSISTFSNTTKQGDYTTNQSGFMIPVMIPTPIGTFSLSYGKQKFEYFLHKKEFNYVDGPVHFSAGAINNGKWSVKCISRRGIRTGISCGVFSTTVHQEAIDFANEVEDSDPSCKCRTRKIPNNEAIMDIYDVPVSENRINNKVQGDYNNLSFPAYDSYNIQAQGLSGSMHSTLMENGDLFGLSNKKTKSFNILYAFNKSSRSITRPDYIKFNTPPVFYMDNEISTHIEVGKAIFNNHRDNGSIKEYYEGGVKAQGIPRKGKANHIQHYSNKDLLSPPSGFMETNSSGFDRSKKPKEGIGAFAITAPDGKTYHYSLPVYNHEIITRSFGIIPERPNEKQAYQEKRQLEPFATHWLLTAVTGPDFVDNGDGMVGEDDLGYWTSFEYGKWTEAFIWKNPYGKLYIEDEDSGAKTWIKGRKELYYLDRVKTRTHTALFVKGVRHDDISQFWAYHSVLHNETRQGSGDYNERFIVWQQNSLRLEKIILVKNSDDKVYKSSNEILKTTTINFSPDKSPEKACYSIKGYILDIDDNWEQVMTKALKVIDFEYATPLRSLARGAPYTGVRESGRLTLNAVEFNGKGGKNVMPPYRFDYLGKLNQFDIDNKDQWGYNKTDPRIWSLNKITTPQGGNILIDYERHKYKPAEGLQVFLKKLDSDPDVISGYKIRVLGNNSIGIYPIEGFEEDFKARIRMGDRFKVTLTTSKTSAITPGPDDEPGDPNDVEVSFCNYNGNATVTAELGNGYRIELDGTLMPETGSTISCDNPSTYAIILEQFKYIDRYLEGGGIRVKDITITDGVNKYRSSYRYGENQEGVGHVSYSPFAPETLAEMPYSSELPAPRVMYEYVSHESYDRYNNFTGKTTYKFNVFKEKSDDLYKIKYGNFYEITSTEQNVNNTVANRRVEIKDYEVKDNLNAIGQMLEVTNYNSKGQILNKLVNEYFQPEEIPFNLGVVQESYQSYKEVNYDHPVNDDKWLISATTRIKYPNFLKSSTEYRNGHSFTTFFQDLHPISGQAQETYSVSSKGDTIKTLGVPAFTKYPEMGSKAIDPNNKNMLSQVTATYTSYKDYTGPTPEWKTLDAEVTTWRPWENNVWRKHKNYAWKGDLKPDGSYLDFIDFNWGNGATIDSGWQKTSEITKYNAYSKTLEVKDINGNKATTKMGDHKTKVIATGNSGHQELFYTGAEFIDQKQTSFSGPFFSNGEISASSTGGSWGLRLGQTNVKAHTGKYSLHLASTGKGFALTMKQGEHRAGNYKVSVWVDKENVNTLKVVVAGKQYNFNALERVYAGDWVMLNAIVPVTNTDTEIYIAATDTAFLDDFRICPVTSSMVSYVYNEWDELTHILNANNLATKYEYDKAGRLKATYTEVSDTPTISGGFKKISQNAYNYQK